MNIRNIAIIAHVDHGKTTLVNQLLVTAGAFRENEEVSDRVMDSNDIERERGITILAKTTSLMYKDTKINILDTPGYFDFVGEVKQAVSVAGSAVIVVDAGADGVQHLLPFAVHIFGQEKPASSGIFATLRPNLRRR